MDEKTQSVRCALINTSKNRVKSLGKVTRSVVTKFTWPFYQITPHLSLLAWLTFRMPLVAAPTIVLTCVMAPRAEQCDLHNTYSLGFRF